MSDQILGTLAPAPATGNDLVSDTTTRTFVRDVVEPSKQVPVLVDFWAPWCGPCRQLSPIIEKVVREAKGAVRLVKMDIEKHPEVAGQLGIQSIPAVYAFVNGQPVDGFVGNLPEGQIKAFIDRLAGPAGPSEVDQIVAEAEALLAGGDAPGASELFAAVLEADPESVPATVGLARCLLAGNEITGARELLDRLPTTAAADPKVAALRAQLDLAAQTEALGDAGPLETRLSENPADHQARFDLALLMNGRGDRETATDHLLEIMRRDRSWNEEGARKQLLQFFEAWGPMDEATLAGRRRLSSVLFS